MARSSTSCWREGRATGPQDGLGRPSYMTNTMRTALFLVPAALPFLLPATTQAAPPAQPYAADHFEKRVRPLLVTRCLKCHGPEKSKAGLRLDSAAGMTRGGESGPAVLPGKPDDSLLIRAVRQTG